ncbi:MAG TPA: PD-(D/E)XK motif protein [Clostridia bacterium]|nr:PD-(D/E)XK motif protein [Clostridia bacterium]
MNQTIWSELELKASRGGPSTGLARMLVHPEAPCEMYVAIEKPSMDRVFMVLLGSDEAISSRLPDLRGIRVDYECWTADACERRALVLRARNGSQNDLFATIAEDLADFAAVAPSEQVAVERIAERLQTWQRFLLKRTDTGLSPEACRGLFGELRILDWLLDSHTLGPRVAVESWLGPTGAPQDLAVGRCAIEVKTTAAKQEQRLRISSEKQLDWALVPHLFLAHVSVVEAIDEGISLDEMVEKVRQRLGDNPGRSLFETRLLEAGYSDEDRERYEQPHFVVSNTLMYEVREGFPCITAKSVPAGVGDLTYSIGVGSCQAFVVAPGAVLGCIRGAAAC